MIAVKSEFQKRGIGNCLINAAENIVKEKGLSFFRLEVRKENQTALHFYKKHDWYIVGERQNIYLMEKHIL